jgi:hypothetical protein
MILEKQKEANILIDGEAKESIGMSLDLDSAQILMQMLSKNLYSDDIGSAIRECASNALDSHRRAGVDDPIIVSFKASTANNYEFCVEDFGTGLNHEDVTNILSKYGKSTKRESNIEIGAMGLGFKSPLSYSSSFYFVCRKDGMERKYMMYEGEDTNTIDLLYEKETTERNGVKIIIPVKYNDKWQFHNKIKEQLCYFESVYFDVPEDSSINNDFLITRHEHFQFSEMSTDHNLHICLDNVYYPLDFEKIGIKRISFPAALRFSLSDGIYPTPNREALRYTQEAKQIIKSKLSEVADYFVSKYNESVEEGADIKSFINFLEKNGHYISLDGKTKEKIDEFLSYSTIPITVPKLEGIKLLNFANIYITFKQHLLNTIYQCKYSLRNKRMHDMSKHYVYGFNIQNICNGDANVYIYQDRIPGIKKDYLRDTCKYAEYNFFVKLAKPMKLGHISKYDVQTYYHALNLKNYPKNQWREVIKEFQYIVSLIEKSFIDLDALVVPQQFIDSRKKVKPSISGTGNSGVRKQKLKGEIVGKRAEELMKWNDGRNCKFVPITYKLEDLDKAKHLKVYCHHDDYLKLDALFGIIGKQKIELVTFSQREINIIKDLDIHNLIPLQKFMEGKTAPFKRLVTSHYIAKLIAEHKYVFERVTQIGYTSSVLAKKLNTLIEYKSNNFAQIGYSGGHYQSSEYINSMLEIATENNLFDQNIYPEILEIKELLTKLDFLNPFCKETGYYKDDNPIVNVLTSLFKYYKHKVDFKHYNIKLNEEVLTEEIIEELVD